MGLRPDQVKATVEAEKLSFKPEKHSVVNLTSTVTNAQMVDIINSGILLNNLDKFEGEMASIEAGREEVRASLGISIDASDSRGRPNSYHANMQFFPPNKVMKAVPIPPVQHLQGTTSLVLPAGEKPEDGVTSFGGKVYMIFSRLGYAAAIPEPMLTTFQVVSGLMGMQYQRLHLMQQWLVQHGVQEQLAHEYLSSFHKSILVDTKNESFRELMEGQTKGGINIQGMNVLEESDTAKVKEAMDGIFKRLNGVKN